MQDIEKKALRLLELEKLILEAFIKWKLKDLAQLITEFRNIKKKIKLTFIEKGVLTGIKDRKAQRLIQQISSGEYLDIEERFQNASIKEFLSGELDEHELEELGSDEFYSWFSHYEYIDGMLKVGALILGVGIDKIPQLLSPCIQQIRHCFVFQQYLAVCALCRTAMEISIRNICLKKGILEDDQGKIINLRQYQEKLGKMINKVSKGDLRKRLHALRDKMNGVIHGRRNVKRDEAKKIVKDTLKAIQDLYYEYEERR